MSEQIQKATVVTNNTELLSIDISELNHLLEVNQVNHMIGNKSYYPIIDLPFPPIIKPRDLIINKKSPQDSPNGKQVRAPNAFIIYRKAFVKAARDQGYILPMTVISSMASASWDQETTTVKEEYKKIAKDAHKLIKEMFPKKSNQRKRKEKWNIVSFHDNKDNKNDKVNKENDGDNVIMTDLSENNNSYEIISPQEQTTITTSSLSSPNLSEFDDSNISEKSLPLKQQSPIDITYDTEKGQISNSYLVDELSNTNIPNSFQEYLNSNFYLPEDESGNNFLLTSWLNQSENYELGELELFDTTSMDDLKINSQSSLNVTLSEVMGIINSENFDLGFEL